MCAVGACEERTTCHRPSSRANLKESQTSNDVRTTTGHEATTTLSTRFQATQMLSDPGGNTRSLNVLSSELTRTFSNPSTTEHLHPSASTVRCLPHFLSFRWMQPL